MILSLSKIVGLPITKVFEETSDIPHTISYAILYRAKVDSLNELPKEKRPPRNLWDKPQQLADYLDDLFEVKSNKSTAYDYKLEDVE